MPSRPWSTSGERASSRRPPLSGASAGAAWAGDTKELMECGADAAFFSSFLRRAPALWPNAEGLDLDCGAFNALAVCPLATLFKAKEQAKAAVKTPQSKAEVSRAQKRKRRPRRTPKGPCLCRSRPRLVL